MSDTNGIFNPKAEWQDRRRSEWVTLDAGRVCVVEMRASESLFVLEHASRPGAPQALAVDGQAVMLWQIVVSCYDGPGPQAKRIFGPEDIPAIQRLRAAEWRRLLDTIERVNALSDTEAQATTDFTAAGADGSSATSPSGALKISTGSPVS